MPPASVKSILRVLIKKDKAESTSETNPLKLIDQSDMRPRQWAVIGICVLLNAIDGFDVMSASFAAPGIASDWNTGAGALGVVLSMELVGMAFGSILLGGLADRIGRRPTAMLCILLMATGMFAATMANNVMQLSACRFLTGIGIGGMLAAVNALVAEFSNKRWRGTAVALMGAGFPIGGILGGAFATQLLATGEWRDVFLLGAIATAFALPLVYFLLPESVGFLMHRPGDNILDQVNSSLRGLGLPTLESICVDIPTAGPAGFDWRRLFGRETLPIMICLTASFFLHALSSYFAIKWIPKIVADFGFSHSEAGGVLVWASIGGLAGSLIFSVLSARFSLGRLVLGSLLPSAIFLSAFGSATPEIGTLSIIAASSIFFGNAAVVGLYAIMATSFPTEVRASGIGFVIGVGRGGSALGPAIGGGLFSFGLPLALITPLMAIGTLLSAAAILALMILTRAKTTR